jgi:hypothetical protein
MNGVARFEGPGRSLKLNRAPCPQASGWGASRGRGKPRLLPVSLHGHEVEYVHLPAFGEDGAALQ